MTAAGPLPPYAQFFDFMSESDQSRLLDWALSNAGRFKPATVTKGRIDSKGRLDPESRIALTTRELASVEPLVRQPLLDVLDDAIARTGTGGSRPTSLELEIAAHGDGAHFAPHLDIPIGAKRKPLASEPGFDRIISAVYYFYAEPRAFSGGSLRLYRFGCEPQENGADANNYVDIEPVQNSLVVFPSWATHEVRRVSCPSGDFRDYRFALNCWYCRPLNPLPAQKAK